MKLCYVMTKNTSIHDQRFLDKAKENNIRVYTIRVGLKTSGVDYFRLKRLLKQKKPDIIQGGWLLSSGFVSALSNYHPFILYPFASDILLRPHENFLYKKIVQFTLKRADHIICDAEHLKKEILRLIDLDNISVIPRGVDLTQFNNKIKVSGNKKWIIITRNFEPIYGIEYFLDAVPKILEEVPEVRVILCGKGSLEDKLKRIVKNKKLEKYVYFVGHIPHEKIQWYLNVADVYVSPSLSDGTSVSLLEAMACKLPCIVTDIPAIKEWIKDGVNGYVVPKRNSEILADKIIELLQDSKKRKLFGERNRKIVEKRADWNKNFEEVTKIWRRYYEV